MNNKTKPKKNLLSHIALLLFMLVALKGCDKRYNIDGFEPLLWTPEIAVPLLDAEISVADLLARNNLDVVQTDKNGKITLVYETKIQTFNPFSLIPSLDQEFSYQVPLGFPGKITATAPKEFAFDDIEEIEFPTDSGMTLKELKLKSGVLQLEITVNVPGVTKDFELALKIPSIVMPSGESLGDSVSIKPGTTGILNIDLGGAVIDFEGVGNADNKIIIDYKAVLAMAIGDIIESADNFGFTFRLKDLKIEHIIGDFGNQSTTVVHDSLSLDIFEKASGLGDIQLTNPQLYLKFTNGIGLPFQLSFTDLYTKNAATGDKFNILYSTFQNPFVINSPLELGDSATTEVKIDKSNTDFANILKPTPKFIVYKVDAEINPGPAPHYNFISDQSFFNITCKAVLPLEGLVNDFHLTDTLDFGLNQTIEELDSATLNLRITNGLPIDAYLQIYLYNEERGVIDSLLTTSTKHIFKAGIADAQGKVNQSDVIEDQLLIILDKVKAVNLFQAEKMILQTRMSTYNSPNQSIAFYDDYKLGISVGIKLKGIIELSLPE